MQAAAAAVAAETEEATVWIIHAWASSARKALIIAAGISSKLMRAQLERNKQRETDGNVLLDIAALVFFFSSFFLFFSLQYIYA